MAPQSFCRWFKQHSGHSFISFLNRARIEKACQLLTITDGTVKEVAYDTGFETISHFNRVFKNLKGVSPKVFKRQTVQNLVD
jgi:AraC-like DNA-binding protein